MKSRPKTRCPLTKTLSSHLTTYILLQGQRCLDLGTGPSTLSITDSRTLSIQLHPRHLRHLSQNPWPRSRNSTLQRSISTCLNSKDTVLPAARTVNLQVKKASTKDHPCRGVVAPTTRKLRCFCTAAAAQIASFRTCAALKVTPARLQLRFTHSSGASTSVENYCWRFRCGRPCLPLPTIIGVRTYSTNRAIGSDGRQHDFEGQLEFPNFDCGL